MLTKTDRWGEKKGQCGESERERETDGSRKNLAGRSGECGKPKNVSRRRTQREGRQKDGEEAIAHLQIFHLLGQDSLELD